MADKKADLFLAISNMKEEVFALGKDLFSCPELGFKEEKTAKIIVKELKKLGVPYQSGVSHTGIVATIGQTKGYHIAVAADMDALPRKSAEGFIHSCGHSIQVTDVLTVLKALVLTNALQDLPGQVSFIFTPAEEFIDFPYRDELIRQGLIGFRSGKQDMIAKGVFDQIDCVLSAHANADQGTRFDIGSTLTGFTVKRYIFHGQASHSGVAPHLGKNTLHGAALSLNALSFLKEQFPPEAGIKVAPVITEPGGTVNITPDKTVLETYIRANDVDSLYETAKKVDHLITCCGNALGLSVEIENTPGYMPLQQSAALNRVIHDNMRLLCEEDDIVKGVISGASGDVGDLGYLLPTVQMGFSGVTGRFHSDEFTITDEENCYINTSKVLAGTIIDLLQNQQLQVKNPNYIELKKDYLKNWLMLK